MGEAVKVLFIGDVIGKPGRRAVRELLPTLADRYSPHMVICNGENAAGGFGITPQIVEELKSLKIDVITSGNHIWDKRELTPFIDSCDNLLRPENYPANNPGRGSLIYTTSRGAKVGVINLLGRVFMDPVDCPFTVGLKAVEEMREKTDIIVVDMHAETTSEKAAMGWYLNGKVSALIGTHTHIQTSDERILPPMGTSEGVGLSAASGTAFITDAGMTGPVESVIGMERDTIIERFVTKMPIRFDVASGPVELQGVYLEVDRETGKATLIERIKEAL